MAGRADNKRAFGKRQQHILILASGDKVRHVTLRPWMAGLGFSVLGMMAVGYLGATSYLVLRDNLIGATMARQARIQHDYEDRISALRAQVDRVTSRQLIDQQLVETKVEKLLKQQLALTSRHGKLDQLIDRAEQSGLAEGPATADKQARPQLPPKAAGQAPGQAAQANQAFLSGGAQAIDTLMGRPGKPTAPQLNSALAYAPLRENTADRADRIFSKVTRSLKSIEQQQLDRIQKLTVGATETASQIETILKRSGIEIEAGGGAEDAVGGPYVAPRSPADFEASMTGLDTALGRLEKARETARALPFDNPAPGKEITSGFGNRVDPFLGRLALHAGIDFREVTGGQIRSSGAGKVTVAGPSGGYGNMVEIDHGYGITTRYGHLSRILVKESQQVEPGDVLGLAGSTGRSTGPHLHYEIRRNGEPVDPLHFLNSGLKLKSLVD